MNKLTDDVEILSTYTLDQAVEDGRLVKICRIKWEGKTREFVATTHLFNEVGILEITNIWKAFVARKTNVQYTLPEEQQMFSMDVNKKKVWVIEDDLAFTAMYPEDY